MSDIVIDDILNHLNKLKIERIVLTKKIDNIEKGLSKIR